MKHFFTLAAVTLATSAAFGQWEEDANVSLGNLSSNLYYDSYNDATKIVNDLNFTVLVDGTNSSYVTPPFTIKVYIWDGSSPTFVRTYNDDGIYHFGSRDYVDQDIDLSDLSLGAGSYRLGVFVDADDAISNSEDDPGDNAYLAAGNINFSPGGSSADIMENASEMNTLMVFPNPATEKVTIAWEAAGTPAEQVIISDLNGRAVKQLTLTKNQTSVNMNLESITEGVYLVQVVSAAAVATQRFVKQ